MKTDEEREKTPAYIVLCPTCQRTANELHQLTAQMELFAL